MINMTIELNAMVLTEVIRIRTVRKAAVADKITPV